jgi:hypothetical protein
LVAPLLFFAAGTGVAVPCVTPGRPPSGRSMATGSTVTGGAASLASPVPPVQSFRSAMRICSSTVPPFIHVYTFTVIPVPACCCGGQPLARPIDSSTCVQGRSDPSVLLPPFQNIRCFRFVK